MVSHRIILTGGGTGGHISPALAVAEQLKDSAEVEKILYIGAKGHLEERLARERGLEFFGLDVSGLPRRLSPRLLGWPFQLLAAVLHSRRILTRFQPTVILGTGGYASAPAAVAASMLGIPYAIHEPDAHPGLVNKLLAANARLISCGMEGAVDTLRSVSGKVVVNGNPVRQTFVNLMRKESACAVMGLNPELSTLLITGGSQGARALNDAVIDALPGLLEAEPFIQIIHQVGEKNIVEFKERLAPAITSNPRYFLRDYFEDLSLAYAVCDLAVCRSGAMTIAELSVTGTAAIFVPYPFAAADHQMHNARFMERKGAALVIPQEQLSGERLKDEVMKVLANGELRSQMRKNMVAAGKPQAARDLSLQLKELSTEYQMRRRSH